MDYRFTDDEFFNIPLESTTLRKALREAKDRFSIKGKLKCIFICGYYREYRLLGSDYSFLINGVY